MLAKLLCISADSAWTIQKPVKAPSQALAHSNNAASVFLQLKEDVVPKTAQNFLQLAKKPAGQGYKGSRFHRVIPSFMCQGKSKYVPR